MPRVAITHSLRAFELRKGTALAHLIAKGVARHGLIGRLLVQMVLTGEIVYQTKFDASGVLRNGV